MKMNCLNTINCESRVRRVKFNVDGAYCLTCGSDKRIKLWNPYQVRLLKTYGSHGNEVLDADASCDSSQIISCSSDKSLILWDVSTGQTLRRLRKHAGFVTCVKFNEDSSVAISGSQDNTVACWDMRSRSNDPFQVLNEAQDCVTSIQVSDYEILTGASDCQVRRYDLRNGKLLVDFLGSAITSVSLTSDGQCFLAGCTDSTVRLIEKFTGEMLGEFTGHTTEDFQVECSLNADNNMVISGSVTGEIFYWDLLSSKISFKLTHTPGKVVQTLCTHPKLDILVTACGTEIKVWTSEDLKMKTEEKIEID